MSTQFERMDNELGAKDDQITALRDRLATLESELAGDMRPAAVLRRENDELKADNAALRAALEDIAATKWVNTIEESMRGGNTPACAAASMQVQAHAALAVTGGKEGV